ncbi:helix-turn-helix domain-containing protein [Chromobacterium violaceum]|uniref:helix-turn-helix domain-containing protein n=1 Tax=Chromobacterium violaceum TaxID=536 RepID=UPI001B31DD60|nr:helix-turn-helix domain-containing protein [Chromobacterium violaceum]
MLYGQRYDKLRRVLRATRRQAGLTQVQLAEKLGRGQSYVSKVERGEQYVDVIEFLEWCDACNTPAESVIVKM